MAKILVIEDDEAVRDSLRHLLETERYSKNEGYLVETAETAQKGIACALGDNFDAVVTDLQMPGGTGHDVVSSLHQSMPYLPVILMTAHHTTDIAIHSTKLGAFDYVLKPIDEPQELLEKIKRAVDNKRLLTAATEQEEISTVADTIIGSSRHMQMVFKEIGRIAAKPINVLIRGETGTGKELMARVLHQHSERADKPFIIVNCVAIPEMLLESELFGHEAGAFTGAQGKRIGRFEQADKGTIFLDEVGDMTIETQAKLLRVLQEKTIQRLGGTSPIQVDVRVIAATHRELERAIEEKKFREDLYHRLNEAVISIPALRERKEDIPELVNYFIQRQAAELGTKVPALLPEDEVMEMLKQRPWPGNVRELKNLVHKALLAARGYAITPEIICKALEQTSLGRESTPRRTRVRAEPVPTLAGRIAQLLSAAERGEETDVQEKLHSWAEAEIYRQALRLARGDRDKAAVSLGVSRSTVEARMGQYGLDESGEQTQDGEPAGEAPTPQPEPATTEEAKILVVEDQEGDAIALKRFLGKSGYQAETVKSMAAALERAQKNDFDLVITDLDLKVPGASGLELISELRMLKPHLPVILLTGYHSPSRAIEATRLGAYEYLPKPVSWTDRERLGELREMVRKAVQSKRLMAAPPVAVGRSSQTTDAIIGKSRAMQEVYKEIGRVAATPLTVLIRGETGTGKELVARALYSHTDPERASQPFIVVNCAAIPPSLLESELFGHERGAFTGAAIRRLGRFEQAHRGTIFLDEIGDMNVNLQQKLLRVLQEKTIERVGGKETVPVDVRIIAATHRDLEQATREGTFRQDLYFRLNVAVIHLPPLRERTEDIPDLVYYFLERAGAEFHLAKPRLNAGEESQIFEYLKRQPWAGNIRELRNVVRRAVLLARGFSISLETFQEILKQPDGPVSGAEQSFGEHVALVLASPRNGEGEKILAKLLGVVERELYSQAIEKAGDQSKAAKWLGVSRPTVMSKLVKYDIHPTKSEKSAAA